MRALLTAAFVPLCLAAGLGLFALAAQPTPVGPAWHSIAWPYVAAPVVRISPPAPLATVACCAPAPSWGSTAPLPGNFTAIPQGVP